MLTFDFILDGKRFLDFVSNNYYNSSMKVSKYSYYNSGRAASITIEGNINLEKVYFSKFDDNIDDLTSFYPNIQDTMLNKKINIKILKFKNSKNVMTLYDDEFTSWKNRLYLDLMYYIFSIIIFIILKMKI